MVRRFSTLVAVSFLALVTQGRPGAAADLERRSREEIELTARVVEELVAQPGAQHAAAEIAVTRAWVGEGKVALAERRTRDAAVIAERLPSQLAVVRAKLATGALIAELAELEREAAETEKLLDALRAELERLSLSCRPATSPVEAP